MTSIQRRPDGRWRARYRDPSGRERARHFTRKVDATRFLATVQSDMLRGAYVDPSDATTVSACARRWLDSRTVGARTLARLESMVAVHIDATGLGGRRLAAVRPSDVQAWASERSQRLAPATVRKVVGLLRSIYATAVLDRLVASSPVVGLTLPSAEKQRVVPLTVEQVRALADAMAPRYRAMVLTQAGLGLRVGELLALRTGDVNFLARTVRVEHQIAPKTLERVPPKTPRSRRTVPLPAMVAEALAAHLSQFPPAPDGLIFHTSKGRPHDHTRYGNRVFPPAVARAGLPAGTTTHDLRHHFASTLLAAGESVVAVAEWLGHRDATLVLKVYAHLFANSDDRMRRVIDSAWSSAAADSTRTEAGS